MLFYISDCSIKIFCYHTVQWIHLYHGHTNLSYSIELNPLRFLGQSMIPRLNSFAIKSIITCGMQARATLLVVNMGNCNSDLKIQSEEVAHAFLSLHQKTLEKST